MKYHNFILIYLFARALIIMNLTETAVTLSVQWQFPHENRWSLDCRFVRLLKEKKVLVIKVAPYSFFDRARTGFETARWRKP